MDDSWDHNPPPLIEHLPKKKQKCINNEQSCIICQSDKGLVIYDRQGLHISDFRQLKNVRPLYKMNEQI